MGGGHTGVLLQTNFTLSTHGGVKCNVETKWFRTMMGVGITFSLHRKTPWLMHVSSSGTP